MSERTQFGSVQQASRGDGARGWEVSDQAFEALVDEALDTARLVAGEVDRLIDSATEFGDLDAVTRGSLVAFVRSVVGGVADEDGPTWALAGQLEHQAARWAAEGLSLSSLVLLYGLAHRLAMHTAVVALEGDPRDEVISHRLLERAAETGSEILVSAVEALMAGFARVQEADRRSPGNWRLRLVRRILAGELSDSASLGYPLGGSHVAVVVRGPGAEAAAALVQENWSGRVLRICERPGDVWLWLGGVSLRRSGLPRFRSPLPSGVAVGIGDPGSGLEGFRESHRQAMTALRLAGRSGGVVAYAQVALVALLAQDRTSSSRFVASELRDLVAGGESSDRDRATIRAYLDCRFNVVSTAARLGVHENTVAKRVRRIEDQLGVTLRSRSTELDVALRLRDLDQGSCLDALGEQPADDRA